MPVPALIGAGASLLGGLFGRPKQKSAEQNTREGILGQARGAREAAEKYGFNPITLLGASSAIGPTAVSNPMGAAIADAGLALAEGWRSKAAETSRIAQLEDQNKELQKRLVDQTLRPQVGGMYSHGGPSIRASAPQSLTERDPKDVYGPRPMVQVRDAVSHRWFGLDPGVADRRELQDGDTWIGEDNEAVLGEVMGNVNSSGAVATNLLERGGFSGPFYDMPALGASVKPTSVAPNLPPGEAVDWFATSGPRAPIKPDGMTQERWDRLVRRNQALTRGR